VSDRCKLLAGVKQSTAPPLGAGVAEILSPRCLISGPDDAPMIEAQLRGMTSALNTATQQRRSPLALFPDKPAPRLYDRIVEVLRVRHYSRRTEEARPMFWPAGLTSARRKQPIMR
jgi:hypothetical protein